MSTNSNQKSNSTINNKIKITPMMQQFLDIKEQYPDCILLFRAGDFYETFYDDAKESAQILNITLTQRGGVPMAGVPFHSINPYIKKLLEHNKKIAIVEQLEDPKQAKGLVKRGVKQILTPGTLIEDEFFQSNQSSYLCSISLPNSKNQTYGVVLLDISTGECIVKECENFNDVKNIISGYTPSEVLTAEHPFQYIVEKYCESRQLFFSTISMQRFHHLYAKEILRKHFQDEFNSISRKLENSQKCVEALGAVLYYAKALKHQELEHINEITILNNTKQIILEELTLRNLDVIECSYSKDKSKTLLGGIDFTKTPMGKRELKKRIISPITDIELLNKRFENIELFSNQYSSYIKQIQEELSQIVDIERIITRVQSKATHPKNIESLKVSILHITEIIELFKTIGINSFLHNKTMYSTLMNIYDYIDSALIDNAPTHVRDFGYIKPRFSKERDEVFEISQNSTQFLIELEKRLKEDSGITNLKVKYNKIFGYYIEISKSQEDKVPEYFKLKQTLVNQNRYITDELKEKEQLILGAKEKLTLIDSELFNQIVDEISNYVSEIKSVINEIKEIDISLSCAYLVVYHNYIKPQFSNQTKVISGRNPIVERFTQNFVDNDYEFIKEDTCKIITGPNMAGKSTFLRQVALISLLAQCGIPVPAKSAELKIYDSIYTRIGAHDELSQNQSTFMVEMSESAHILHSATTDSLVIFDEIGRGTSTFDGMALAQAIVEEITKIGANTLFATHYHQLNELENTIENICNYHVEVEEKDDTITFLHKIKKGGVNNSYGIHVAKLANLPQHVVNRAQIVLNELEEMEKKKMKNLRDFM